VDGSLAGTHASFESALSTTGSLATIVRTT
jgi:hypothetical protein